MATAPPDDSVLALCKYKLIRFRVTELKHVLHQLGLPKHGKKQELLDRLTSLLCVYDQQDQEKLVQTVNDTFRTMQGSTNTVAASRSPIDSGHNAKSKKETDDSPKLEAIRCPCGLRKSYAPMIKCDDPQCNVRQHVDCVIFPEQPAGNSAPEPSSSFYCEMCRISRADPFWVTVNHPLLPILIGPSIIAEDGSYMVQYTGRSFALSKANREMLQKAEYDLQVWCILLNDKVPFRMHWPLHTDLQINGSHVRVVNRQPKQKLGANGRDDGLLLTDYLQEGSNKLFLSSNDTRTFCLGIRIVKRRTLEQVLNLVPKEQDGEKFDDALARVCHCVGGGTEANNGDSDSDIEVVADSFSLNLRCPMTASKIRVAGRFKPCAHMGCFDLEAFIEINQKSRKWQCPICLKNYCLENIIIDPYFNRITSLIQNCGDETTEIDIRPDGSWRVKGGPEVKQLAQWHLPDGTLCMATDSEAPPNTGLVGHEIIEEPLSEELCRRTRSGNRKNSNGQWRVTKKGLVSSSDGGRRFENKSPATFTDPTDDVGTGDESCTREPGRNDYLISHIHELESSPSGENVPPPSREQDVIVLSDSDDDDDIVVLSPKAVNCSSVPNPLETFGVGGEQPGGDPNGATNLPLEEGFDDLVLSFCDFPTSPQHDASYQLFGTGAQVTKKELKKYSACDQPMHEPVSVGDLGAMGVAANRLENGHDGTLKTCVSSERNVGRISSANLSDQPQTCHDLHSDNYDESLVTASQKKRSSEGRIAALDASVGWRIADDDLLEEGFDPFSPPRKRRSVRPKIDTNC